jgi:histidinol dehydrogenase
MTAGDGGRGSGVGERAGGEGAPFRFTGRVTELSPDSLQLMFDRSTSSDAAVREGTARIVRRVRDEGDEALRALARELDGVALEDIEVPREAMARTLEALEPGLRRAMERTARNVRRAHEAFRPVASEVETEPGIVVGRRPDPLGRVGVYAPGGRAAYPSSVLMGVIPAKVAGVGEVILCSPPGASGLPSDVVLAAAALAGADRVFALGGAGAVAAMAYGTATVPRVDRIVGPGNAWVAEAKLQVSGAVAIDSPAGPSELLVIADDSADATVVAREVLAQAEHDPMAAVVAVCIGGEVTARVAAEVARLLPAEPRRAVSAASLASRGGVLVAASLEEAVEFSNRWAPEHLLLALRDTDGALALVRNAGTVFVGETASVAFGDYMTGANHVLPTGGLARSYSGLSTLDFVRWTTWQRVSPEAAARLSEDVGTFADAEGLPGHASAGKQWSGDEALSALGSRRSATEPLEASPASKPPGAPAESREHPPAFGGHPAESRLFRPSYRDIPIYSPHGAEASSDGAIDVSDNTNLWGAPPGAMRALRAMPAEAMARYPTLYAHELKVPLAAALGVRPEQLVTGCGSDDVLDSAMRAFAEPGDRVAFPVPTFTMVPTFARMSGLEPVGVPLRADAGWDADADALLATGAQIIYLCSPNNPTGTLVAPGTIAKVIARAPGLVIVDEAYAEFAGVDMASGAPALGNVLVTRTLSKAFGLAGLRIGYGIGAERIVREVEKARGPYMVSAAAQRAALAALAERDWVAAKAAKAVEHREWLSAEIRALGLDVLPSHANFLLVRVRDAAALARRLRTRRVIVRALPGLPVTGDAIRVGVGPWDAMTAVARALRSEVDADDAASALAGQPMSRKTS